MANAKITDEQLIACLTEGKSNAEIAEEFNLNIRTVARRRANIARTRWDPGHKMGDAVPEGYYIKGITPLYGKDGTQKMTWVKMDIDRQRQHQMMQEIVQALSEEIPRDPGFERTPLVLNNSKLLNCYVITDYHLGMMAWHEETGADWDLKIAEDLLYAWFAKAIETSPNAEIGVFAQLGDFMHWDGLIPVTPKNRNVVDADTRFQKLVRVAITVIRRIIAALLEKHDKVILIQPGGNHDEASTPWLRELFYALYEYNERVIVDRGADLYTCYEFGSTSLFFHHGHRKKPKSVDSVFVAKFREVFGRTKHSYGHMGHMHNELAVESNLMIVEQHRTLASPDAYAAGGGWMSGRDAKVITYHQDFGEVSRLTIRPEMLK